MKQKQFMVKTIVDKTFYLKLFRCFFSDNNIIIGKNKGSAGKGSRVRDGLEFFNPKGFLTRDKIFFKLIFDSQFRRLFQFLKN